MSTLPSNSAASIDHPATVHVATAGTGPRTKRWTRQEYHRLAEQGWFQRERVELVDGEILVMSPQSPEHFLALERVYRCLARAFGEEYWIRQQGPVTKGEFSEPEPDICVVKGPPEQYTQHPSTAHLVVEVSKTSLRLDRSHTLYVYASMNVPDYWVLDLEHRQLHVHRQPIADSTVQLGHRYESVTTIAADGNVAPLERPGTTIAVADMLPPVISPDA